MQCRHARLHSLVICQAMYSGAARSSDDPGVAAPAAAVGGSAATAVAVTFASILDQSLLPEKPQERGHFAADRTGAVFEAVGQSRRDLALVASCFDFPDDRGA